MTTSDYSTSGIRVTLNNVELWQQFYPKNEMVVTRAGRKLFPDLEVKIEGLDRDALYTVHFHLERLTNIQYHFNRNFGQWEEAGLDKNTPMVVKVQHNRGGLNGSDWMKTPVSFSHMYITNTEFQQKQRKIDLIRVSSMHRYQPVITVRRVGDGYEEEFRLTMTEFFVVTAYQDPNIIELKKANNKYANGFRPEGRHMTRPQDDTPRRGKRANPSGPSDVTQSYGPPAMKMMTPPSLGHYLQTPATPSGPPTCFQNYQMITPPALTSTPSTMITPPSLGATPPSDDSQTFRNPVCPPSMVAYPAHGYTYSHWNPYGTWDVSQMAGGAPQGNSNQVTDDFQNFQQFGNPDNVLQNNLGFPSYDGAGTSSSNTGNFDFGF
ncbi:unnamed protein product [Caenorhabditis brenneri]